MRLKTRSSALILGTAAVLLAQTGGWQKEFPVDKARLGTKGDNPYFNLTPGYRLEYQHGDEADVLTVLDETKLIDGVETRVVEDRETRKGQVVELTKDYYAIDSSTNDVYYFGEEVDAYKNGKIAGHEGTWLSGVKGAKFGLMMPASPKPGQKFYQELAPRVGMDRVQVVSVAESVVTPAGSFDNCVHVVETSPIEKGLHDHKWYARGIGQVKDGSMLLVRWHRPS
jgi:hypothetical protein